MQHITIRFLSIAYHMLDMVTYSELVGRNERIANKISDKLESHDVLGLFSTIYHLAFIFGGYSIVYGEPALELPLRHLSRAGR